MAPSSRRLHSSGRRNETSDIERLMFAGESFIPDVSDGYMAGLSTNTYPTGLPADVTRALSTQPPFESSRQTPVVSPRLDQSMFGSNSPIVNPSRRPTIQPGHVVDYLPFRSGPSLEQIYLQGQENLSPQASPSARITLTEHEFMSVTSSGSYPSSAAVAASELNSSGSAYQGHRNRGRSTRYAFQSKATSHMLTLDQWQLSLPSFMSLAWMHKLKTLC